MKKLLQIGAALAACLVSIVMPVSAVFPAEVEGDAPRV